MCSPFSFGCAEVSLAVLAGQSDQNCQQFRKPDLNSSAATTAISNPHTVSGQ